MNLRARIERLEAAEPEPAMECVVLFDDEPVDSTGLVYRLQWSDYEQESQDSAD